MDRRSLLDGDATPSHERENVFGDEFEVDEWDMVADGFRPTEGAAAAQYGARQDAAADDDDDDDDDDPPIRSVSAHYATGIVDSSMAAGSNRNSTRKSRSYANPFASHEDAEERAQSLEFEPETNFAHRTLSSASSRVYARTDSPRFGAGPSHPYGMYTQGTVPRSPSVTTAASTVRQSSQRQSYSQSRPQHPYAMYPQGVDMDEDLDDDDDDRILPNPVPVGFPGLGQNYTRRIGPDGEDQGIVDEDGHTEQLPPYSRYPEDGPEKMPLLPPTLHSRAPVAGTDPGMELMHTTLLPTQTQTPARPQSMTDPSALARHSTAHSLVRMISSSSEGTNLKSIDEKRWKEKTWKEKRKTRFCGIPFWWILLSICVVAFITAVLGGVIGSFVAGGKHHPPGNATVTTTLLYDASLMPSPTSGAPPMGTFAINLGPAEEIQSDCLVDSTVAPAWNCNLAPNSKMGLVVQDIIGDGQGSGATLFYNSNDDEIAAGAQLSSMWTRFSPFLTVTDNDDKDNGLAFYFQDFYDKIVVVPEHSIDLNDKKRVKRDSYNPAPFVVPAAWRNRKEVLVPGAKPWFCIWNETFVEGFVYVNEPVASSTSSSSSSTSASLSSTSSVPPSSGKYSEKTTSAPPLTTAPPSNTASPTGPPTDVITTTVIEAFTTAVYNGPAQGFQAWKDSEQFKAARHEYEMRPIYKRQSPGPWDALPYVVKIEERRLPNSPQPYCQQYQILDNGQAGILSDDDGPIIVNLNEQDPNFGAYQSAGTAGTARRKRGASQMANACHCQWMSGEGPS